MRARTKATRCDVAVRSLMAKSRRKLWHQDLHRQHQIERLMDMIAARRSAQFLVPMS